MSDITATLSPRGVYDRLCAAEAAADPFLRAPRTSHWVMNLEWYKAIRRAYLPPDADDKDRDETKWEPDPGDMVLGRTITVTQDGGEPHLVNGRA